jgi:hypothetical protein
LREGVRGDRSSEPRMPSSGDSRRHSPLSWFVRRRAIARRQPAKGQRRGGHWQVGWGCSCGIHLRRRRRKDHRVNPETVPQVSTSPRSCGESSTASLFAKRSGEGQPRCSRPASAPHPNPLPAKGGERESHRTRCNIAPYTGCLSTHPAYRGPRVASRSVAATPGETSASARKMARPCSAPMWL